jgi:metal-responsive CopG/Arc/MetJ family transcriptional regulator
MQISLYDNVENRIDKSMIETARDELKDALYSAQLSNMEIVATQLVVNDQGNICLRLSVLHGDQQQFFDAYYLIID